MLGHPAAVTAVFWERMAACIWCQRHQTSPVGDPAAWSGSSGGRAPGSARQQFLFLSLKAEKKLSPEPGRGPGALQTQCASLHNRKGTDGEGGRGRKKKQTRGPQAGRGQNRGGGSNWRGSGASVVVAGTRLGMVGLFPMSLHQLGRLGLGRGQQHGAGL